MNDAPVAVNDSYATNEDASLTVVAAGVLSNDTRRRTRSADGDPRQRSRARDGDAEFRRCVRLHPGANFNGSDSFTYQANDGTLDSAVATVAITSTPVNDAPVAANDSYSDERRRIARRSIAASGVLATTATSNDDPLTAVLVSGPDPRGGDAQPRRLRSATPRTQLQRHGQLHLPGQRRPLDSARRHRRASRSTR